MSTILNNVVSETLLKSNSTPKPTLNENERIRSIKFWRPESLSIVTNGSGQQGDDFRADLKTSEQLIYGLLMVHDTSPVFDPATDTWNGPGMPVDGGTKLYPVAFNSRQPVVCVAWPDANGKVCPWITDGRQRARASSDGHKNRGAVEAINHRLSMLVLLAKELQEKEHGLTAVETQIATRNEAKRRASLCASRDAAKEAFDETPADDKLREEYDRAQREVERNGAEGWAWAVSSTISAYTGGRLGDEKTNVQVTGLIMWRTRQQGGPQALEFVCWVEFEPVDRDPAKPKSLIASVALKNAQVSDPPSVEAQRLAHLVWDPNGENGREDRKGLGMPVSSVAKMSNIDRKTVQLKVALMDLEPEVMAALDAYARGEQGLSLNQVRDGGFWLPGTGSTDVRVPRSRDEQLQILEALRGKRGVSGVVVDKGTSEGSKRRSGSEPREVSGREGTRTDDRKPTGERVAPVGPDSPTTAGAPKVAQLVPEIFRALADRLSIELEGYVATADGKMPDGSEKNLELCYTEKMLEAAWELSSILGGDEHALDQDAERGAGVNEFRKVLGDSLREVLSARGLILRAGGARADGAPVLPVSAREPAEVIVTPRAGGEVGQMRTARAADGTLTELDHQRRMGMLTEAVPSTGEPDSKPCGEIPLAKSVPLVLATPEKREKVSRAGRRSTLKPEPTSKKAAKADKTPKPDRATKPEKAQKSPKADKPKAEKAAKVDKLAAKPNVGKVAKSKTPKAESAT